MNLSQLAELSLNFYSGKNKISEECKKELDVLIENQKIAKYVHYF